METKTGLDDFFSTEVLETEAAEQNPQVPAVKEAPVLTPVEQELYDNFSPEEKKGLRAAMAQMDFNDPNMRTQYGRKTREGIANISTEALKVARTRDLGEAGKSVTALVKQLKGIDLDGRSRGIFGRARSMIEDFNIQLTSVERNIEKSVTIMQGHQAQLASDNVTYDQLYAQNRALFRSLTRYIIAGKLKLDEERKTTLAALEAKATTGDGQAIEDYTDYKDKLDKFERLLDEFESIKLQCLQTAPALRMAKSNNEALIEQFDFIILTVVPSWQTQLQLMLAQKNTSEAAEAANAVIDIHNEIIRNNAKMAGENNVKVAQITGREITETETLEFVNKTLIDSLERVIQIQAENKAKRAQSRLDKARMEQEMKDELLKLAKR